MQYLMYFYTEVIGLSPARAGLIYLLGMIWDAVSDQTQSDATLLGMRVIGLLIPAVVLIVSALLMVSYPLSKQRHEEILAERK